jgi:CO/xanthine dehydrogenase FAD-binding subunit
MHGSVDTVNPVDSSPRPVSWDEALALRSAHPEMVPICGGTDLMVEINFGRTRPARLLDLTHIPELDSWELVEHGTVVRIGAGVSYTRIISELKDMCPGLAMAARTVGSPQIRNRGTVAGNLGTASPAGDSHPPLFAARARIEAASTRGTRLIEIDDYFLGPKRNALEPDELIRAILVPVARGPQQFAKVGPRTAMVIATVSFAVSLDPVAGRVGTGIGSAGPTPLRAGAAEQLLEAVLRDRWSLPGPPDADTLADFGRHVAAAAAPIDDVRGTANYRRHALSVISGRCLKWAWTQLHEESQQ